MSEAAEKAWKRHIAQETPAYNILAGFGKERDEAHVHSKIIYFLLDRTYQERGKDDFLKLFLRKIQIPEEHFSSPWRVCRVVIAKIVDCGVVQDRI